MAKRKTDPASLARERALMRLQQEFSPRFLEILSEELEVVNIRPAQRRVRLSSEEIERMKVEIRKYLDKHYSYDIIAELLGISHGTAHNLAHEDRE